MNPIRLSKSVIGEEEKRSVLEVLDSGFLGMGKKVHEFESDLESFLGRPVACVINGTAALQLAVQSIGVTKGDEVLVPSLTYVASFQAISATGAIPVACDVNTETGNISIDDAKQKVGTRTKAIMPVHYGGNPKGFDQVLIFAKQHGLRVIEDAAHAFGSQLGGRKIGSFGDICCFSFDGIKNITSGEGGCVVTSDLDVLNRVRDARLLGVRQDTEKRFAGTRSWVFDVTEQGWRHHMSDLYAAIGIEQLKKLHHFNCSIPMAA